jgi:hypothetical protein
MFPDGVSGISLISDRDSAMDSPCAEDDKKAELFVSENRKAMNFYLLYLVDGDLT